MGPLGPFGPIWQFALSMLLGPTWTYLGPFEFIWTHIGSLGFLEMFFLLSDFLEFKDFWSFSLVFEFCITIIIISINMIIIIILIIVIVRALR